MQWPQVKKPTPWRKSDSPNGRSCFTLLCCAFWAAHPGTIVFPPTHFVMAERTRIGSWKLFLYMRSEARTLRCIRIRGNPCMATMIVCDGYWARAIPSLVGENQPVAITTCSHRYNSSEFSVTRSMSTMEVT